MNLLQWLCVSGISVFLVLFIIGFGGMLDREEYEMDQIAERMKRHAEHQRAIASAVDMEVKIDERYRNN